MFCWLKRLAAPLAAVALFVMTAPVHADPVVFYTEGHFTAGGTGGVVGSPDSTLTVGAYTLTYVPETGTGSSGVEDVTPGFTETTTFGRFTSNATGAASVFSGARFTLDIFQVIPNDDVTPDLGTFVATVSGNLQATLDGDLQLVFDSPVDKIIPSGATTYPPGIWYHVNPEQNLDLGGADIDNAIRGSLSVVPLPATAWVGMALFGGLGLKKMRRRGEAVLA